MSTSHRFANSSRRTLRTSSPAATPPREQESALRQRGYYSDIVSKNCNVLLNVRFVEVLLLHLLAALIINCGFCIYFSFCGSGGKNSYSLGLHADNLFGMILQESFNTCKG